MKLLPTILAVASVATAFAQAPLPPTSIKGELVIRYDTRTQRDGDKPKTGVTDKYNLALTVSDTVLFKGTIEHLPFVKNTISANQPGMLTHTIECLLVNPRNPVQTANVGRLFGTVPIDADNVYRFEEGNLRIGIFGTGQAGGFESKVKGLAKGKPTGNSESIFAKAKKEALKIGRSVGGKTVTLTVTKYDQMEFVNHTLSSGPAAVYPEATVNGPMIFDYDRTAWYFNGVTVTYSINGVVRSDKLTGNIRWIEAPNRRSSGLGEYQFDIRVNEPPPSVAAVFAAVADEAAFFETSNAVPALTGTMKYKDTMSGETVTNSLVTVDLKGNELTKQQVMILAKLLMMSSIVPLNAE